MTTPMIRESFRASKMPAIFGIYPVRSSSCCTRLTVSSESLAVFPWITLEIVAVLSPKASATSTIRTLLCATVRSLFSPFRPKGLRFSARLRGNLSLSARRRPGSVALMPHIVLLPNQAHATRPVRGARAPRTRACHPARASFRWHTHSRRDSKNPSA